MRERKLKGGQCTCLCKSMEQAGLQHQVVQGAGEGVGGDTLDTRTLAHPTDMSGDVVQVA